MNAPVAFSVDSLPQTPVAFRPVLRQHGPAGNAAMPARRSLVFMDVVREFGGDAGFWNRFAEGIESLRVEEGRITLRLKE